jgi:hypothetical protein
MAFMEEDQHFQPLPNEYEFFTKKRPACNRRPLTILKFAFFYNERCDT